MHFIHCAHPLKKYLTVHNRSKPNHDYWVYQRKQRLLAEFPHKEGTVGFNNFTAYSIILHTFLPERIWLQFLCVLFKFSCVSGTSLTSWLYFYTSLSYLEEINQVPIQSVSYPYLSRSLFFQVHF
jgi:hypothetical protein